MAKAAMNKETEKETVQIDATGIHYRQLNENIREMIDKGCKEIILNGVNGQRYIGDGIVKDVKIIINGVPGNDLGAFMSGPLVIVNDNAQDGVANTMNAGKIVVKGHAGDVLGYGMRGGKLLVAGDVGYRIGIHMKSYKKQVPIIVAGGHAGDFFGEYMAGGILVLLGLGESDTPVVGNYLGTGMHGGVIYIRGSVKESQLGKEVRTFDLQDEDNDLLTGLLQEFAADTGVDTSEIKPDDFMKLCPFSHRPYGNMYVY